MIKSGTLQLPDDVQWSVGNQAVGWPHDPKVIGTSEGHLIEQASQGDEAAWFALIETHQESIYRLAYLLLQDADEATDVTQEAFIKAFQAWERFDTGRPLRPWLSRITVNLARNRQRSLRRYFNHLTRCRQHHPPEPVASPQELHAHQTWQSQQLWQAIQRLKQSDQEVIYLRFFLELSVTETAEAIDVAPGTVKSRLHRALRKLRSVITTDFPALAAENFHEETP